MQPGFTQGIPVGFLLDVLLKAGVLDATDVSFAGFQSAPELTIVSSRSLICTASICSHILSKHPIINVV